MGYATSRRGIRLGPSAGTVASVSAPAWRDAEDEWYENEASRYQAEVAADDAGALEADAVATQYREGRLDHERMTR